MNEDTIKLLKEVNSGCKNATNSIEQVMGSVKNEKLREILEKNNDKHVGIGDRCHDLLNNYGEDEKDPPAMIKAFAWASTEMKLMLKGEDSEVASLMVDGCNMGIKSLSQYLNKYGNADEESRGLAKELVEAEQDFMDKLLPWL